MLARFLLHEPSAVPLAGLASPRDGQVLLFSGFEPALRAAPGALDPLLKALEDAAAKGRQAGLRFFAAFLDPSQLLALAPLYNWHR